MKIGFFTDSYLPSHDGVATSVETSAHELQRLGHEVSIIAPNQPHQKDRKNVHRIISIRTLQKPEIWVGLDVPQPELFKVASLEFDIIHGHSGGPISLLGLQLAKLHDIPFIETYHTLWKYYVHYFPLHLVNAWMLQKVSKLWGNDCDALIAPSYKIKTELINYGVNAPIYVLPSGIPLQKYSIKQAEYLHEKLRIPKDKKIILTVGRLEPEKSLDFVIKVFAEFSQSRDNFVLCIVGEGREKQSLKELAQDLNVSDSIYFVGAIPFSDMPLVYKDSYLFVFGSQTETQGMVIVESLATGVPVIAVQDSAIADAVQNGLNGFLVRKDVSTFADQLHTIVSNKHLYEELQRNTKQSVKKYSISEVTPVLIQIYEQVIYTKMTHGNK